MLPLRYIDRESDIDRERTEHDISIKFSHEDRSYIFGVHHC